MDLRTIFLSTKQQTNVSTVSRIINANGELDKSWNHPGRWERGQACVIILITFIVGGRLILTQVGISHVLGRGSLVGENDWSANMHAFLHLCLLLGADIMYTAPSSPCLCDFPQWRGARTTSRNEIFLPQVVLVRVFYHNNSQRNKTRLMVSKGKDSDL